MTTQAQAQPQGWIGYDWFKLIVMVILLLLLLVPLLFGPPAVAPAITAPPNGAQGTPTGVTLSGTGTPGSQLEILAGGAVIGSATVGADGNWGYAAPPATGAVSYAVRPAGGSTNSASVTVNYPAIEPPPAAVAPAITGPAAGSSAEVGKALKLSGTGAPGSQLEILEGDKVVGTATVGADGTWSFDITPAAAGAASYGVRPVGASSPAATVDLNVAAQATAAPVAVAPAITSPADNAQLKPEKIALEGTGTPGSQIEILAGDQVIGTATVGADGSWSFEVGPAVGPVTYSVRPAGSTSSAASVTVNYPAVQPPPVAVAPAITAPADGASVVAGAPLTISGSGAPASQVEILQGDQVVGMATVGADGTWSFDVTPAAAGTASYSVRPVGASSPAASVNVTVTEAAAAPAAPAGPAVLTAPADGATVEVGKPLTISGTGTPGSQVEILDSDKVIGTVTVQADGTWSYEVTPSAAGTAAYSARPVGSSDVSAKPIRVTIGSGVAASCTQLAVGCDAWVTREKGLSLRLRGGAGLSQQIITRLPVGTQLKLLEGSVAADGYTWWRVSTPGGNQGWVAGEELRTKPD